MNGLLALVSEFLNIFSLLRVIVTNSTHIIPFLVETAADPLMQSLVHRAVINQEHDKKAAIAIAIDHAPR